MSRRSPARPKRQTKITIPQAAGPHVKLVFAEMSRQNVTYDEVEQGAGVLRSTLKAWRHKNAPGLVSIEAVFGFLGWDFVPVPRAAVLPKPLVAALEPIAAEHGVTLARTISALVEITTGIHDRVGERAALAPAKAAKAPIPKPAAQRRPRRPLAHPNQPAFFAEVPDDSIEIRSAVH